MNAHHAPMLAVITSTAMQAVEMCTNDGFQADDSGPRAVTQALRHLARVAAFTGKVRRLRWSIRK